LKCLRKYFFLLFCFSSTWLNSLCALEKFPISNTLTSAVSDNQKDGFSLAKTRGFIENKGQLHGYDGLKHPEVKYYYDESSFQVFILENGLAYQFRKINYPEGYEKEFQEYRASGETEKYEALQKKVMTETYRIDMELSGASKNIEIIAEEKSMDYFNLYNCDVLDVHHYKKITYKNVYPGIDWVIYFTSESIKYDFVVQPSSDPSLIKLQFHHHEGLEALKGGGITVNSRMGSVSEKAPVSYQSGQSISTSFILKDNELGFSVSDYDRSKTLTIDPTLVWATYYGDYSDDRFGNCATDATGNVYLSGATASTINIASGGHQNTYGGSSHDAFLVKFDQAGNRLWATYYGGTLIDMGHSCATDPSGNVFLTGYTTSTNNIASGGHQNSHGGSGSHDAFLVKFNTNGTRLWATYYGGLQHDEGHDCTTDNTGNVYLCGETNSTGNIASGGFLNALPANTAAFLVKFNAAGTRVWGTYYGGSSNTVGYGCATDLLGNVFLSGTTTSNFGISSLGHQNLYGGSSDAFLVKFNSLGIRLWASYYGGTLNEEGYDCAVDGSGNVILCGYTNSFNNISSGGFQNTLGGITDAYLVKFNPNGLRLWATYYGGSSVEGGGNAPARCASDNSGNILLVGRTVSSNNIAGGGIQNVLSGAYDAFLVKFTPNGQRHWGTYYGGSGSEYAYGCSFDPFGYIYLSGTTASSFNIASGGFQNSFGGFSDDFLVKICGGPVQPGAISGDSSLCVPAVAFYSINPVPGAINYSWTAPPGWTISSFANHATVTINSSGVLSVLATNSCGPSAPQTLSITGNPIPVLLVNSGFVCSGGSFTISPVGALTYSVSGGTFVVSPFSSTSYSVSGTSSAGCISSVPAISTVTVYPLPLIVSASLNVCFGHTVNFSSTVAANYTILPGSFNGSTAIFSPTASAIYSINALSGFGCASNGTCLVNVLPAPTLSFTTYSITCGNLGSATVSPSAGIGPFTYTWMPSGQNGSIANNLNPGTYTLSVFDLGTGCTTQSITLFLPLVPLTGSLISTDSLLCNGINSGSAAILNLSGGSGNQFYLWTNGVSSYTSSLVSGLSAGQWSVTVTDALTACQINSVFTITQPPAQTLNISASSPSTCAGTSITFTATNSGGTPGLNPAYTYTWAGGPNTDTTTSTQITAGNYVFTVQSSDANNCIATQTIAADWVPNPVLSVSDVFICPLEVGTFTVSGASSFTWLPSNTAGNSFTQSAIVVGSTQYSVIGLALSCTSMATASLIVKPTPNPFISHNSPSCENSNLVFTVSSGTAAVWSGPSAFTSASINNTLSSVQLNQGGVYDVTVTALNSCTASASASLTVKPLPQFSITPSNSSICLNTTSVSLSISTLTSASAYTWFPNSGLSTNNGTLNNAYPTSTTIYTVIGSLNGCTNSAQTTVNVVPPPGLTGQFNSPTLCSQAFNGSPNTITLSANGANTYSLVTIPDMFNANPGGPVSPLTSIPPYTGAGSATLSGSNGVCTVTLGLTFTVLPNPNISVNNYTPVICAGETFTYTNQGASTYTWSSATPGSTLYSNGGIAVASPTINSVFSVFGGSLGCNSALQTTTITVNPLPTLSVNPNPLLLCLGSSAELFAQSNGTSFIWLPPYGLNSYTSQQVSTHINQNQNYTVIATLNNCSNTAVAQVSILPLPSPQIIPVKDDVCLYETIHLKGEGGMYYVWTAPNLQTYTIQNLELGVSHMALAGTYTLKVVDANACFNYSTHPVVVHDLPNGYLKPERIEFCVPYCNTFTFVPNTQAQITQAGPWSMNNLIYSGNSFTSCFSKAGEFSITGPIQDEFNCKNIVNLTVIGRPKPVAAFYVTPENPVEGLDEVSFVNVSSNIIGLSWQSSGSVGPEAEQSSLQDWQSFQSTAESPKYLFEEAGVYGLMLMVKNEFNCWDTVMKTITVESDFTAYIPNAFTPNGDGLNDTFYPVMRGVKKFELQIFDRWGAMVFASNTSDNVWDGTYKGQECKQDVYNYKLVLLNVKREEKVYSGSITLYR